MAGGDRVAYGTRNGVLVGLALHNREGDIGSIFAADTGLAESLRRFVRSKDFFSEARHQVPSWSREWAGEMGVSLRSGDAYNLIDTYHVLLLRRFPGSGYDGSLVGRMRPEELRAVADIAKKVFRTDSDRWLKAQLDGGDTAFVARVDGRVVGFALLTSVGYAGRLHTLAALPEYRGRGIGRELVRARLAALEALGARYAIAEVARWNLASLQLLYAHGFEKAGEMFVETARRNRPAKRAFRR
jgi:ribosomal protein S18 acetylase RimI-like enzyme